jgi:poly-gamma-glutamate capsule biosynthesis protein CapA/YwtB (metallophosphatase superfamily)
MAVPARLPIYIEDSHAGSFYFLAEHLDLDRPYTLLLFDAHSDASPIFNSDAIRMGLRSTVDLRAKVDLFRKWRESGKIQCYNWIEPLMPFPFARVLWIPPKHLDQTHIFQLQNQCRLFLDGHEEVCPRSEANLSCCYSVTDLPRLKEQLLPLDAQERPIVVSIDLDFFCNTTDADLEAKFREVFLLALSIKHLAALTFSISTPYLRDAQQADRLLTLAVEYSCRVANAEIEFEPFAVTGPDTSARAGQLGAAGLPMPKLALDKLSETCRNRLLSRSEQLSIREQTAGWNEFLTAGNNDLPQIRFHNRPACAFLTVRRSDLDAIKLEAVLPADAKSVCWYSLQSTVDSYSLSDQQFGFADGAPRWIYREPKPLSVEPILSGQNLLRALDPKTGFGVAEIFVRFETNSGVFDSKLLHVACIDDGNSEFRHALSAEFNLPYIFFASKLATSCAAGPEVGLGSDCANFVIYALRQSGWQIPWSDAKHLIPRLGMLARVDLDQPQSDPERLVQLRSDDFENGVIVVFDNHAAALWSTTMSGFLGLNDLVVHQLEGRPEIVPLAHLAKTRRQFTVLTVPRPEREIRVLVGGDVMLGRTNGKKILNGADLFQPWKPAIKQADLALANLECSICSPDLVPEAKPYCFRAPPEASDLIARAGFAGMLVANNHTGDFGQIGFEQTISALRTKGVAPIGGGSNLDWAVEPARFDRRGVRTAVFGCASPDFCSPIAGKEAGICPWDASGLLESISQAKRDGEFCIVLCHWDADNDRSACRARASEWIDSGADVVIGSGPHHVLATEIVHGRPVFYSIGNLLFDGAENDPEWSRGALVELVIAFPGDLVRARVVDLAPSQRTANACH